MIFVEKVTADVKIEVLFDEKTLFKKLKGLSFVTDVTFHQLFSPFRKIKEGKRYFSGK